MRVKCIGNSLDSLSDEVQRAAFTRNVHLDQVHLVIGAEYAVYGIACRNGTPWFLVCEYPDDEYPKPHLGALFRICDNRIPPGWLFTLPSSLGDFAVLPELWARDTRAFERLVDGEKKELEEFLKLKQQYGP